MTCHAGKTKEGAFYIACRPRGRGKVPLCDTQGCPNQHEKLCDYPVQDPKNTEKMKTCDRKMCRRCTNNVGPNKDFCPPHYVESLKGDPHGA